MLLSYIFIAVICFKIIQQSAQFVCCLVLQTNVFIYKIYGSLATGLYATVRSTAIKSIDKVNTVGYNHNKGVL